MLILSYDLRGLFKKELTPEIIYSAVFNFIKKNKIKNFLTGTDFNKNNLIIADFLYKNFASKFIGILPTPLFYYEVIRQKKGGIMITASHLDIKYSGLKFILRDGNCWKPTVQDIKVNKLVKNISFSNNDFLSKSSLNFIDKKIYNNYFEKLKILVKPTEKIYVNFDLRNLFLKTSLPYFEKLKIFHDPSAAIKVESDFDNDRIFIYYKKTKLENDLIFYLLSLSPRYHTLAVPIYFSQKLVKDLIKKGKKIFFIKTGHYNFKKSYKKLGIDFGFEPSGHFYLFKDLKTESVYLPLYMFLKRYHKNLDEILALNKDLGLIRLDYLPKGSQKKLNLDHIVQKLKSVFNLKIKKFDGFLLKGEEFYLHLRESKTENKIRISYEGNKNVLKEIKKIVFKNN